MNLTLTGTAFGGAAVPLGTPYTLVFHTLLTCPYDELTLTLPPVGRQLQSVRATVDGETLFEGLVVEQTEAMEGKPTLRLVCRSRPGHLMAEKQLNPYAYFRVTGTSIVQDYAVPFGAAGVRLSENREINIMLVSEKESYWDYILSFFVQAYGKAPYLGRDRYLRLSVSTGRSFRFVPGAGTGERYTGYSEKYHTRGVSDAYFYTGSDDFGSLYGEHYRNPQAATFGLQRELYLHPTRTWVTEHERYANYLFYKDMIDSRTVQVTLPGWHDFQAGDQVTWVRPDGESETLYVGENRIAAGRDGIVTTASLWDPARNLFR